MTLGENSKQY
jgi:hypothetical protein